MEKVDISVGSPLLPNMKKWAAQWAAQWAAHANTTVHFYGNGGQLIGQLSGQPTSLQYGNSGQPTKLPTIKFKM